MMQSSERTTSTAPSTAVDTAFQPENYWKPETHPHRVEIASVNWNGNCTYSLDARPAKTGIAYKWRIEGDHDDGPVELNPTDQPMTLGELMDVLESNCVAEASLEDAWGTAWDAAQADLDFSDPDAVDFGLDGVSEAYSFSSDIYPALSDLYDERFAAWRDQQKTTEE